MNGDITCGNHHSPISCQDSRWYAGKHVIDYVKCLGVDSLFIYSQETVKDNDDAQTGYIIHVLDFMSDDYSTAVNAYWRLGVELGDDGSSLRIHDGYVGVIKNGTLYDVYCRSGGNARMEITTVLNIMFSAISDEDIKEIIDADPIQEAIKLKRQNESLESSK